MFLPTCIQAQDLTNGLLAWYKFDGDTKDASSSAKHGTSHNVTFGQGKCGDSNSAIYLNGKDAYIDLPLATQLNGRQKLTITAWVKPIRFNNIQHTLKSVYSHWIDYGNSNPIGILFGVSPDSSVVNAFSGGYQVSSVNSVVHSNEWQLIVLLYDGTKTLAADRATFQVNCTAYNPTCNTIYSTCSATPSSIGNLANYTYIGTRKDNSGSFVDYFEGFIDDVRIYDRVLTKDELNKLFLLCGPLVCDDNNCLTEDQINPNTCQCEHTSKPKPDCNDNNNQTDDTYNESACACEHVLNPVNPAKPGVYTPSSFTPNKDGINDIYKPIYQGVGNAVLTIFDRWGEVIFKGSSLADGWDGTYRGIPCMQGIYPYSIKGIYDTGEEFTVQGSIVLVK
ncbi:hypothetical protein GCM10028808_05060 [Spirosoma migulaei]